jgi:prepilin-type N-terminal cleavage/methylation domain-containing protein
MAHWEIEPSSLRRGPAASPDGFTLIELLIVVVIIGILAAVAIPQFSSTKEKAFDAAAKSDLRNLMSAQEAYLYDFGTYASSTADLRTDENFNPSTGVNASVATDPPAGYKADASHGSSPNCFRIHIGPGGGEQLELVADAASGGGECGG